LDQAARERGQLAEQVIRSIVFRIGKEEYVMVLAGGGDQISWSALRSYLGQSRMTMATPDEVRAATGYETGAVSPFGLPNKMRILVDRKILLQDEVSIGSGVRGTTVILRLEDLLTALGDMEVGDFLIS
jgi:Cys-tRNA(Pro) deacylase